MQVALYSNKSNMKKNKLGLFFLSCLFLVDSCIKFIEGVRNQTLDSVLSGLIGFLIAIVLGVMAFKMGSPKE